MLQKMAEKFRSVSVLQSPCFDALALTFLPNMFGLNVLEDENMLMYCKLLCLSAPFSILLDKDTTDDVCLSLCHDVIFRPERWWLTFLRAITVLTACAFA